MKAQFPLWTKIAFLLPYISIMLLGLILYLPTFQYQLTYLDDHIWVLDYQWYFKDAANISRLFTEPDFISGVFYRPVLALSFMFNAMTDNGHFFSYRLTNLIVHVMNGWLLFYLLGLLKYDRTVALGWTWIFTVHPVFVSAVAWIPGRTDTLLALFVFSSFICFIKYIQTERRLFLISHWVLGCLALLTKETAVSLPIVCLLFLIIWTDRSVRKKLLTPVIWIWMSTIISWLFIRQGILSSSQTFGLGVALGSVFRNSPALITYFGKCVLPVQLSVLPILKDSTLVYGGLMIFLFGIFSYISHRADQRKALFGLLWFLAFLGPALIISFIKHEYRLYLPFLGFILLSQEILYPFLKKFFVYIVGVLVLVFLILARQHLAHYQDQFSFWHNAMQTSPHSPLAHRNLGAMCFLNGNKDMAERAFLQALSLNPEEKMANNNLGLIYMQRKEYRRAEQYYIREVKINPDYDNVYYNWGLLCYQEKRYQQAETLWEKAVACNPHNIDAYKSLLVLYENHGSKAEAGAIKELLQQKGIVIPQAE